MVHLPRILVVGCGIAGLATVLALREHGFVPELVEARREPPADGAAITLHANGVRALRELGVGAELESATAVVPRWTVHDAAGHHLCTTDLADLWAGVGPCLGITRARLMGILHSAAEGLPLRLGCAVTGVEQEPRRVRVGFADGSTGEYDLVVGADGARSTVRRLGVAAVSPRPIGTTGWRSVVPGRPPGVEHLVLLLGEDCFFGLVPVGDGQTYGFAGTTAHPLDATSRRPIDRLRSRFAHFRGPVPDYLDRLDDDSAVHVAAVEDLDLNRWCAGRVVLIGDAAHTMPPHMGQGGSLAAEDALVLAEELGRADTLPAALGAYSARRRPRVARVREQTLAAARAWMAPPAQRDPVLRDRGDELLRSRYTPLRTRP